MPTTDTTYRGVAYYTSANLMLAVRSPVVIKKGYGGCICKYHAQLGLSHHINPWLSRHYRLSKHYKSILSWHRRPPEQVSLHLLIFKALDVRPVRILPITKFTFVPWTWNNKTKWSRQIRLSFWFLRRIHLL